MSPPENTLRLLTMRNPWAWATIFGDRTTDNRARGWLNVRYRGLVGIQVAKAPDARLRRCVKVEGGVPRWVGPARPAGVEAGPAHALRQAVRGVRGEVSLEALGAYGFVIGLVELVDVHLAAPTCCGPWGDRAPSVTSQGKWPVHLTFANPRPLWPFIESQGALGLQRPTPEVAEALLEVAGSRRGLAPAS